MKNHTEQGGTVMRNIMYLFMGLMLAILVLDFSTNMAAAGEMMPSSEHVKVLLDNGKMRVSEAKRPPGTIVPMHTHPPFLAYMLSTWSAKFTSSEGIIKEKTLPRGKLIWSPMGKTHALEITGTADQHILVIEFREYHKKKFAH